MRRPVARRPRGGRRRARSRPPGARAWTAPPPARARSHRGSRRARGCCGRARDRSGQRRPGGRPRVSPRPRVRQAGRRGRARRQRRARTSAPRAPSPRARRPPASTPGAARSTSRGPGEAPASRGPVAEGLDVVSVRIEDVRRVVVLPVLRAETGRPVVPSARGDRRFVERVDHRRVVGLEPDVRVAWSIARPDPEIEARCVGEVRHALRLEHDRVAERCERLHVVLLRGVQIGDTDLHVVEHCSSFKARVQSPRMILENGLVRTMDPALPTARALPIAGELVAGGVGTHETALPTPDVVDLGGRCVLPAFTDSHVHFPTWSVAQSELRLEQTRTIEEALDLVRAAVPHVTRGVVEVDEQGEPTGVLREESCWAFRDRYVEVTDDEYLTAMRAGVRVANARGVAAVHDKDGWLGALRFWQRLNEHDGLTLRVWQSLPHEKVAELESADVRAGLGGEFLRLGYLKAFMDGTLGSQTARLLDGSGVQITSREELEEIVRRGARAGFPVAVHAIGDLANRE